MSRDRIHESSRIPNDLFSILAKQLCLVMALAGLFYSISILMKQYPLLPTTHAWYSCANFRTFPSLTVNTNIEYNDSSFVGDHVILGNNQQISIEFPVSESNLAKQNSIAITSLVSRLNPFEGYAPIDISINNRTFVTHFTMPGTGYKGQTTTFTIPADFLTVGKNTVTIQVAPDARSNFWLYNIVVGSDTFQNDQCKLQRFTGVLISSMKREKAFSSRKGRGSIFLRTAVR